LRENAKASDTRSALDEVARSTRWAAVLVTHRAHARAWRAAVQAKRASRLLEMGATHASVTLELVDITAAGKP
jgi:hypothetical protein